MKQKDYKQAISQIRWTAAQRQEILRQLADEPEDGFEDDDFADSGEYQLTGIETIKVRGRSVVKESKTNGRKLRIGLGIAAAVVLLAGGAVTAVLLNRKARQPDTRTSAASGDNKLGLHLTDEPAQIRTKDFVEAELGYYFYADNAKNRLVGGRYSMVLKNTDMLCFAERGSSLSIPLCAQPTCKHDGSKYCPATTKEYDFQTQERSDFTITYADGYLWTVAVKDRQTEYFHDPDTGEDFPVSDGTDAGHEVLLRYEPDGTGITEIHDFGTGRYAHTPVYHRGYLFFAVDLVTVGEETENAISQNKQKFMSGGYDIWAYELATGELTRLVNAYGDPQVNHVDDAPTEFMASGDYLFFRLGATDWENGNGSRKLNLRTGKMTKIPDSLLECGVNGQYALQRLDGSEAKQQNLPAAGYYLEDLKTGEQKYLKAFENEVNGDTSYYSTLKLAGNYLISEKTSNKIIDGVKYAEDKSQEISVYDLEGNKLTDVTMPELSDYPAEWNVHETVNLFCVENGVMYLAVNAGVKDGEAGGWALGHHLICCPISDIIAGKSEWKYAFSFMDEAEAKADYEKLLAESKTNDKGEQTDAE